MGEKQNLCSAAAILDLVHPYRHDLYRFCKMLTRSEWDADDLVQETLVKLFTYGRNREIPVSKSYLFRTATNAWIDICRKNKVVLVELQELPDTAAADPDPIELHGSLELLLETLPLGQATVVLLMDVFQYTAKETAQMIDSTEGAVKAMLHRARAGIRKQAASDRMEDGSGASAASRAKLTDKPPHQLISRFLDAFRRYDPYEISAAYMELQRNEIEVGRHAEGRALFFRFRDPEGNLCVIHSELF
ncbi:RNA polymerase sigma factor [Paenibacillus mesophilus]|uniref:RNA polymerase sigma factor n=1 Tax=Paenibacillus mesophilus TaxID=2582849 RepID=UPI00110EAEBE|nr:RNA polymerase sigma factor [Paenibacillus mesophilus]TMV51996.1 RNA polymerase sigma factor [Paenibacillus mesophilus]